MNWFQRLFLPEKFLLALSRLRKTINKSKTMPDQIPHTEEIAIIEAAINLIEQTKADLDAAVQKLTPLANENFELRQIVFDIELRNSERDEALAHLKAKITGEPVPGKPEPSDAGQPTDPVLSPEESDAEHSPQADPTDTSGDAAGDDADAADLDQTSAEPAPRSGRSRRSH